MIKLNNDQIRQTVRSTYAKVANAKPNSGSATCCSAPNANPGQMSVDMGYSENDIVNVPEGANMGLGCGNPKAIAALKTGETVLDLGSGGGFDCFLAAKEVGESGYVIGVDMTPEMVSKARANADKISAANVDFRLGEIEHLPVADNSVDVIISNCVINLSPEKQKVFDEAYRVLKIGGRLAISDIVTSTQLPEAILTDMQQYSACVSGASSIEQLTLMLEEAGFKQIKIEPKDESKAFIKDWSDDVPVENYVVSATIEALKP